MSFETPTLEKPKTGEVTEAQKEEAERIRTTLRPVVESLGGTWQVNGVPAEDYVEGEDGKAERVEKEIYAFYVPVGNVDVEGQIMTTEKYMRDWLEALGYAAYKNEAGELDEEELSDPDNFPDPGKFRRFLEPPKNDTYLFRIAGKEVRKLSEEQFKKAA